MLFALIGAVVPRLFSFFGKRTDDKTILETQGLETVRYALRYHGLRTLIIVVVSVITALWGAEQLEHLIEGWQQWHSHTFHLFGAGAVSSILGRL